MRSVSKMPPTMIIVVSTDHSCSRVPVHNSKAFHRRIEMSRFGVALDLCR